MGLPLLESVRSALGGALAALVIRLRNAPSVNVMRRSARELRPMANACLAKVVMGVLHLRIHVTGAQ